jgi:hypothetical protein
MTTYEKINLFLGVLFIAVLALFALNEYLCAKRRRRDLGERVAIQRETQLIVIRSNNISYDKFEFVTDNVEDYAGSDTIDFYLEGRIVARFLRDDIQAYYEKGHINMCNNILEGQKNGSKAN